MNRLAAQIGLGCLIVFFSFVSIVNAYWVAPPHGGTILGSDGIPTVIIYAYPPQSPGFAWATATSSLGVVACGIIQRKMVRKYASWQIFLGTTSFLASVVLGFAITNEPWISGNIYYLGVVALISGLGVIFVGFFYPEIKQLMHKQTRQRIKQE